jgi:hypothetical protein
MDITLEKQFTSLRSALKVLSLAALVPAGIHFVETMKFVRKTQQIASDMLPEGIPLPPLTRWTFVMSNLLATNTLFLAPVVLAAIGGCVWITVQYKSGHFLYFNLGLCLLLLSVGAIMRYACFKVYATIVIEMNPL